MRDITTYTKLIVKKLDSRGLKTLYNVRAVKIDPNETQEDVDAIVKLFKLDKPAVIIFNLPSDDDLYTPYHPIERDAWRKAFRRITDTAIAKTYTNYIFDNGFSGDMMLIYHVGDNKK